MSRMQCVDRVGPIGQSTSGGECLYEAFSKPGVLNGMSNAHSSSNGLLMALIFPLYADDQKLVDVPTM